MRFNPEQFDQVRLVSWFNTTFPELKEDLHHYANERKCSWNTGKILKSMGVKKGVADLNLAIPNKYYAGLWLELKVGKGRLTKEQVAFLERKNKRGYLALAVWGYEAAKIVILKYLEECDSISLK